MASVAWDVINILMLDLASSKARVKFKVLQKVWGFFWTRIKLIHVSCLEDRNQVMLNVFLFIFQFPKKLQWWFKGEEAERSQFIPRTRIRSSLWSHPSHFKSLFFQAARASKFAYETQIFSSHPRLRLELVDYFVKENPQILPIIGLESLAVLSQIQEAASRSQQATKKASKQGNRKSKGTYELCPDMSQIGIDWCSHLADTWCFKFFCDFSCSKSATFVPTGIHGERFRLCLFFSSQMARRMWSRRKWKLKWKPP